MLSPVSSLPARTGVHRLFVSIFLLISLTLPALSRQYRKKPDANPAQSSIVQKYGAAMTPRNEIVSMRSLTSRHYDIDGNTRLAVLSTSPMFFANSAGELEEISDRIVRNEERAGEGYDYRNEANDVYFYFSADGSRCAVVDGNGEPLAVLNSAYAAGEGTIAASGNRLVKSFDEGSSDFAWAVRGSAVSYRYFVDRKIPMDGIERGTWIDWRQEVVERERFADDRGTTRMSTSTFVSVAGAEVRFGEEIFQTETTTTVLGYITLYAALTGTVYKSSPGSTPVPAGSEIRLQNLSDPGCSYGYRGWTKYDLSGFTPGDTIHAVDLYVHVSAVHDGLFDYVDINVSRLATDPETSSAAVTWGAIQTGTSYVYDLGIYNTGWRLIPMPGSDNDLEGAIASPGWFGLGMMVWCDENNSDFLVNINGVGGYTPYLNILYSPLGPANDVNDDDGIPLRYGLQQNYPNPFNPKTTIGYTLAGGGPVRLSVYNMLGQEVAVLVNEVQGPGKRTVSFEAGDLPSGVYVYRLTAGTFTDVKRMILVR